MPSAHLARLAKLLRPRLGSTVVRDRLLRRIDDCRSRPAVWISGPPGAGKTTVLASYTEQAGVPTLWYHADVGDSDPATFFHYLRSAHAVSGRRAKSRLPPLTAAFRPVLEGFARRFFRELFAELPTGALLAIDNYQEIEAASPLHAALAAVLQEIPPSANIVVVSRLPPSAEYARALVSDAVSQIGWDDLRLTEDETRAFASQHGERAEAQVAFVHERAGGWAAGVRLLLEEGWTGSALQGSARTHSRDTTFAYFASEVYGRMSSEARAVLLRLSYLPRFTARAAIALSGDPQADRVVADLFRRRLFVDRLGGAEIAYRFHDLFLEFLQHEAATRLSPEEQRDTSSRAARLLAHEGRFEEALPLLARSGAAGEAAQLVKAHAGAMLAQGRFETLLDWLSGLPAETVASDPWMAHWHGRALLFADYSRGKDELVRAFELALAAGNRACAASCAARILHAMVFHLDDAKGLDPWCDRLLDLAADSPESPCSLSDPFVRGALLLGLTVRRPDEPRIVTEAQALVGIVPAPDAGGDHVWAWSILMFYGTTVGNTAIAERAAAVLGAAVGGRNVDLMLEVDVWTRLLCFAIAKGELDIAQLHMKRLRAMYENRTSPDVEGVFSMFAAWLAIERGEHDAAASHVARWLGVARQTNKFVQGHTAMIEAYLRMAEGRFDDACRRWEDAVRGTDADGRVWSSGVWRISWAAALTAAGRLEDAERALSDGIGITRRFPGHQAHTYGLFVTATLRLAQDRRRDACAAADAAFAECRHHGDIGVYYNIPHVYGPVCALALSEDIQADYVREFVRRHRIEPPARAPANWPWPVVVRALGGFSVTLGGAPIATGRRTPRKALALLQLLAVLGPEPVPESKVLDVLWPDDEGDTAREALGALVQRVRKLLGSADLLRHAGGKLFIDRCRWWADTWAFEESLRAADYSQAMELYRGPLLGPEDGTAWALPARERLRNQFITAVGALGRALTSAGRTEDALALYQRGTSADDLVESFHLGTMRCHAALGRPLEAIAAYRRMRDLFSVVLGVSPSAESRALFEALRRTTNSPHEHDT